MRKNKLALLTFALTAFNFVGKSNEKISLPREYTENITIEGYDVYETEYDFDNDGTLEKIVINKKSDSVIATGGLASIYTLQDGQYELTYQIPLKNEVNAFSVENTEKTLKSIKNFYSEYSKGIEKGEVRVVNLFGDNTNENVSLNLKYDKNSLKNMENFLFIGHSDVLREAPTNSAPGIATLKYKDKPRLLLEFTSLKDNTSQKWYFAELGQEGKIKGYIKENAKVIRRGFYWDKMINKIEIVNDFITKAINANEQLYIITEYAPLSRDKPSKKDKFGNKNNQSIIGYTNSKKEGEIINIPDQTIFRIIGEENNMLKIETPFYGGPYFIEKVQGTYQKVENIKEEVNKFIAIDPSSQTEVLFQRIPETQKYEVITYSYVTTGKDGYGSYETPHGAFLIAFTRPYMTFTRHARPGDKTIPGRSDLAVAGSAKYAVRFSGGGYMHGIPTNFNFKGSTLDTETAKKIGTYKESHKCVRHFDDQIEFIVKWINADSKIKDRDNTIPEEPVIAVVL